MTRMSFSERQQVLLMSHLDGKIILPMRVPSWYSLEEAKSINHQKVVEMLRAYA